MNLLRISELQERTEGIGDRRGILFGPADRIGGGAGMFGTGQNDQKNVGIAQQRKATAQDSFAGGKKAIGQFSAVGCDGGKTGSTNEAGCCLAATAKRDDMRLVSVVVGAKDSQTRFNECSQLFNYGFANFENVLLVDASKSVGQAGVSKGKTSAVELYPSQNYYALVKKNEESPFAVEFELSSLVKAPVSEGENVGKITISKNGVVTKEIAVVTREAVEKLGYLDTLKKIGEKW